MGNNPSDFDSCGLNCPVELISWEDAEDFMITLNAMGEGSYTFPTEAQWEYAARAGSNKAFANGGISDTTTDSNLDVMGWYASNSGSTPHAVAQKQPNAWGLYDMHGNVYEWCQDWYGTYPDISVTDPGGHHQARPGWNAAAAGSTAPRTAGRLSATPTPLAAASTASACGFQGRLSNNLFFYDFIV
jgi:formylglycine-generating enzyme required for sulfatase activity